ncbi:extracellular solute-binding protein [Hahella ganghwensis]|uniref:extracellular solute-binding protein n=1 Tax=Hahella ganghwensis TaxID=286420 RepID=UPI00035CBDAA|nr:extracellular solute-binding protein [Hahella ganghwensis]
MSLDINTAAFGQKKIYSSLTFLVAIIWVGLLTTASAEEPNITISHGFAMHGDPQYPEDFEHFSYANPNAPKGGTLKLGVVGDSFDSFNPYVIKGVSAAGIGFLHDTLAKASGDEAFSEYGLLAEKIEMPDDRSWVAFHLNPKARFHDGHPITAEDVIYTFKMLTENDQSQPFYKAYYADVEEIVAVDDRTVRFNFKSDENRELPLILGQLPVLPKHYYEKRDFSDANLTVPLGSGPYKIKSFEPGRSIVYERVKDYWAAELPVNKGFFNFDEIVYEYYKDHTVALEAFKAGEFDVRLENTAKSWATAYTGPQFERGDIIKEQLPESTPKGMQAFIFNIRRDVFKDPKVREALGLAFDFEWTNANLFYGQYSRTDSYWVNSELASDGLPSGEELDILKRFKGKIPEKVFTEEYQPPTNPEAGNIRKNLRKASQLLKEAGWVVQNGKLVNKASGKPLAFEITLYSQGFERIVLPFIQNLKRLGIDASLRRIDTTQYINRLRDFDFDMVVYTISQSNSPGNEQIEFWHSSRANVKGSRNLIGIADPVIDELIELVIKAPDRESLIARTHALDRVLLWNHFVIPQWHLPYERIAYWKKLAHPEKQTKLGSDLSTWWIK